MKLRHDETDFWTRAYTAHVGMLTTLWSPGWYPERIAGEAAKLADRAVEELRVRLPDVKGDGPYRET